MDSRKIVWKECSVVAIGVTVGAGLMLGIYALIGRFAMNVLLGGIAGAVVAIANFFFMAVMATLAADKAESGDPQSGQKLLKASYPVRLAVLAVVLYALAKSGLVDVVALVLPLVFVRPTITIAEFFRKKGA